MWQKTNITRYNTSFDYIFFNEKTNLIPTFFPVIVIYITNKIYPGNSHFMLYQLVQKLNDLNLYL